MPKNIYEREKVNIYFINNKIYGNYERIVIKYLKILKYEVRSDYSGSALFRNFL